MHFVPATLLLSETKCIDPSAPRDRVSQKKEHSGATLQDDRNERVSLRKAAMLQKQKVTAYELRASIVGPEPGCMARSEETRGFSSALQYQGVSTRQGRTVRKIEFSTTRGYHAVTIFFEDNTLLNIALEPLFILRGRFSEVKDGTEHVVREWPTITSISDKP